MTESRSLKYSHAIREGFFAAMRADSSTFMVGEGIGVRGGCFTETLGLYEEFGPERLLDMPISESAFMGMCAGAAACGSRSIVNLMYLDFATVTIDQIVNQAAKIRYLSAGQYSMPMTIVAVFGSCKSGGAHHSQSLYPWFVYVPGIKVVMPSTPYDVKGLVAGAVMEDNLVLVLFHRALLNKKGQVPEEDYFLPLEKAEVVRQGSDVTLVGSGAMRYRALEAAEKLTEKDCSAEVIDPRILSPLDMETIAESVRKTNRLVIVDEGYSPCGLGGDIVAGVQERVFDYLDAPMQRVHTLDFPIPYSPPLENEVVVGVDNILAAVERIF
jgi:pyruvate dehydrogenase E1 component beta subunit